MPPATSIPNAYQTKAENVETLRKWHKDHSSYSAYVVFNFVVFPVISWVILLFIFWYLNSGGPEARVEKIKARLESNNSKKIDKTKFGLQNEFTLSLMFVMFSSFLSVAAGFFLGKTDSRLSHYKLHNVIKEFSRVYSIAIIVIIQDLVVWYHFWLA